MTPQEDRLSHPEWRRVVRIYAAYGLRAEANLTLLPEGVVYAKGRSALAFDPPYAYELSLHDLAHWMVAPGRRRRVVNFGLGPHPSVVEKWKSPELVAEDLIKAEEAIASYLNVAAADFYFGRERARRVSDYLSCHDGLYTAPGELLTPGRYGQTATSAPRFRARLTAHGFLSGGRFVFKEVPHGS